ncbi:MAG: carboxylating nicotinate-nucleotide diphosphorylase [Phycisphaerae bacterium]|nr:carboxylating nicotinate-nucleotide diphosphorylase [Phycisphaerae bacterium]
MVELAREEDLGTGDVTGRLLPASLHANAKFVAREPMVLCGAVLLDDVARAYDDMIEMILWVEEGKQIEAGQTIAEWFGPAWAIMAAERVALNFLQHLSGVATTTRKYVDAIADTKAKVYDTRKTIPGWRELEKYAVRVGGGMNHRRGLYDAVLVKDNHLAAMASDEQSPTLEELWGPLEVIRQELGPDGFVEIEVDTLSQLTEALKLPVDIVMLDNMPPDQMRKAVEIRDKTAPEITLEASGGITLETILAAAMTGVERIAVGSLTHSARAVDIGLDIELNK